MVQHNGDCESLHIYCSYIYGAEICRVLSKQDYPNVKIRLSTGKSRIVNASSLFHISLTEDILNKLSDDVTVLSTGQRKWTFKDRIPAYVFQQADSPKLLFTNLLAVESNVQPFPVATLDTLQHLRHRFNPPLKNS